MSLFVVDASVVAKWFVPERLSDEAARLLVDQHELRTHRRLVATPRQVAREVLDSLPEDCSLEDIAYHLYVRAQVEEGVRDLDEGRAVPHAQVMREGAEWLRKR